MATTLRCLCLIPLSVISVLGQLSPLFFPNALRKQLQTGKPAVCPNEHPDASVDLPSPMPEGLQGALAGLQELLDSTIDASYPALTGKPQAAVLQLDYRGEKLAQASSGDRDPQAKRGLPDMTTIFRIGSVSKIFPVLMLYQLFDKGVVSSLDDPLSKYAPDFALPNIHSRAERRYTLRQLASQLSGLPRELPCSMLDCHLSTKQVIDRYRQTPGAQLAEYTEPSYSNAAYSLLGNVLADYIKVHFSDYVQQHILEPLGMRDTGFVFTKEIEERMAKPYSNQTLIANVDIGYNAPAGQMYSNINDLMRLGRYYLGVAGSLFDDSLRRELLMPGFLWRDGTFLQGSPWEAQFLKGNWIMLGKGGNIFGFSAIFGMIPPLNLTFAALWSGHLDETSFVADAFERILPEFVPVLDSQRPAPRLPEEPLKFLGRYHAAVLPGAEMFLDILLAPLPQGGDALKVNATGFTGWLNFHNNLSAYLTLNGAASDGTCFRVMATAFSNAWVTFDLDNEGRVVALQMPGSAYGVKFAKQESSNTVKRAESFVAVEDSHLYV